MEDIPATDEAEIQPETSKIEIEEEAIPTEELQPWMIEDEEAIADETIAELAAEPAEEIPDWLKDTQEEGEPEEVQDELSEAIAESDIDLETGLESEAETLSDDGTTVVAPDWIEQEETLEESEMSAKSEEIELETPEGTSSARSVRKRTIRGHRCRRCFCLAGKSGC